MSLKTLALATVFTAIPLSIAAQNLVCVSAGYCVNDLTCNTNGAGEELTVKRLKGNRVEFGWSPDAVFTAKGIRKEGFTVYIGNEHAGSMQTLVLADDLTATMGVTTILLDKLYDSSHNLTCTKVN